jgi:hypothetical protein
MQKVKPILFVFLLIVGCVTVVWGMSALSNPTEKKIMMAAVPAPAAPESKMMLYDNLRLDTLSLSRQAFEYALEGYKSLKTAGELPNDRILSIVDFSLPSSGKRLFIIDIISGKLLFNTFVSHGRNSGAAMATRFSNKPESNQSSLGFYVTGDTYRGEHGYSLKLEGKEKGINDNAYMRKIVVHGANYVNEKFISQKGYIGRSLGCPAIPDRLKTAIINVIRDGSCMFLYSPDRHYLSHSSVLAQIINPFAIDSLIAG